MACTRVILYDSAVFCTAIAPDGELLAAGLRIGDVLLDARSGVGRTSLGESSGAVFSVAFSPAGPSQPLLLTVGCGNSNVQVWDCSSSTCVAELQGHSDSVYCVAFSPNGRLLVSASADRTVRLWRADWHTPPAVLEGHTSQVFWVSFSCDSRLLASCSLDGTVRLWHVSDTAATAGPMLNVGRVVWWCVTFSPVDSSLLACCGQKRFLALARVDEGINAIAVERELQGHTKTVLSLAFSPCGRTLASGSYDNTVRLWSVASGACLRVLRGGAHELCVCFGILPQWQAAGLVL